ncbi:S41 family peptidase [Sphingomonas arenae]|uniref:S41 family peptidase n=1 Tax=Sphingomonas arenae TaxID=2812555 RepID=UPI001F3EE9F3|nr:S41 family peptidase [Sphingomonas arenae]
MRLSLTLLLTAAAPFPSVAQTAVPATPLQAPVVAPFVKAEAESVVSALAKQLEEDYVFPDIAKRYATMLRSNLAAGKYSSFADAGAFAKQVSEDLAAVHPDGHLDLKPPRLDKGGERRPSRSLDPSKAITRSGWIAPGVAYIGFELFPSDEATAARLRTFLEQHKDAKTLILDARAHHGGGLGEMDVIFPYLFATPTELVRMDTRVSVEQRMGSPVADIPTVRKMDGPEGVVRRAHWATPGAVTPLREAKVFVLTSKKTASAAEHFALSLKRTGRATLIGETTYGAGNYGGLADLGHGYSAFIPVGRTFDPDTGEGWDGVGIKPDVAVAADEALDEALKRAGVSGDAKLALANLR